MYQAFVAALAAAVVSFVISIMPAHAAEPIVITVVMKDGTVRNGLVENLAVCKRNADELTKALPGKIALISCQRASSVGYQQV